MSPREIGLFSLLIPAVVAALGFVVARRLARRVLGPAAADGPAAVVALGAGYLAGNLLAAPPAFPPREVTDRIPWIAGVATAFGLVAAARPIRGWTARTTRLIFTTATLAVLLEPILDATVRTPAGLAWLALLLAALPASWASLDGLAARLPAGSLGPARAFIAAGAGIALALSGSLVLGRLGLSLAAALGAVELAAWRGPWAGIDRAGTALLIGVLGPLLVVGHVFASLPGPAALAIAAAPATGWLLRIGPLRRLPRLGVALVAVILAAIPIGLALAQALGSAPEY